MAKTKESRKGRPARYAGMKIYKIAPAEINLRSNSRRRTTLKNIRQGMVYETFIDAGGSLVDLKALVAAGLVEVK